MTAEKRASLWHLWVRRFLGSLLIAIPAVLAVRHFANDRPGQPPRMAASLSADQRPAPREQPSSAQEPAMSVVTERPVRDVTPQGVARIFLPPQAAKPRQPTARSIHIENGAVTPTGMIATEGRTVRLYGIAFPEAKKICKTASGERWPCGRRAYIAFHNKIVDQVISCEPHASDPPASDCFVGEVNLAAWLLAQGLVRLAPEVGDSELVAAEAAAKRARLGLWLDPETSALPQVVQSP